MQAARRLYLYVMSGITLSVVATGLILLARVALRDLFPAPSFSYDFEYDGSREQLSQAIAMLGVGTPVWAVHWWLVQRGLRPSNPEREAERGSALRAAYFTLVLLVSLLIWVSSAIGVIGWVVVGVLNARPEYDYTDPLGAATLAMVAFVVWLFHGLVRRRDLATGNVVDAAAWLPRLYLYGVAIGALLVALRSVETILVSLFFLDAGFEDAYRVPFLVGEGLSALGWGLVWYGHWFYAGQLALRAEGRGADERVSRTRAGAFVCVIVVAAAAALRSLAGVMEGVIGPAIAPAEDVFGEPGAGVAGVAGIAAPAIAAALYAVTWWLYTRALAREPAAADPLRALHQARLTSHGIAATMLLMGGAGAAWVAGYVIEAVFGGPQILLDSDDMLYQLPMWLSTAVVGLGAWLVAWRRVVARRRRDPIGEASSTIRRTFLYLTLGTSLVAAIGSGAVILYRLTGLLLDAGIGGSLARELATPLGVLIVASLAIVYHGLQLRGDTRLAAAVAAAEPPAQEPVAEVASESAADVAPDVGPDVAPQPRTVLSLTLQVPGDTDPAPVVAALRAVLPPGSELTTNEA